MPPVAPVKQISNFSVSVKHDIDYKGSKTHGFRLILTACSKVRGYKDLIGQIGFKQFWRCH